MDEALAEYLGIHFGDGHLSLPVNASYRLTVSLNLRDKKYAEYVSGLYLQLFEKRMHYAEYPDKHLIILRTYQKSAWQLLHRLGAPIGRKLHLRIPLGVKKDDRLLASFLRGLFDTDGCTVIQKDKGYSYPQIRITMKDKGFAEDVQEGFGKLGLKSYICRKKGKNYDGYDVTIRNKESYKRFFKTIGTRKRKSGDAGIRTQISTLRTARVRRSAGITGLEPSSSHRPAGLLAPKLLEPAILARMYPSRTRAREVYTTPPTLPRCGERKPI